MRELFIKCFGRLLAILGCSTLVTACYGVPPMPYTVSGHVTDGDTGEPVEGILVRVSERYFSGCDGEEPQYGIGETRSVKTSKEGEFDLKFHEYGSQDVIVEWQDVDGPENKEYQSGTMIVPIDESENITIAMTPESGE